MPEQLINILQWTALVLTVGWFIGLRVGAFWALADGEWAAFFVALILAGAVAWLIWRVAYPAVREETTVAITGSIRLRQHEILMDGSDPCAKRVLPVDSSLFEYTDIHQGTRVRVEAEDGEELASGMLTAPQPIAPDDGGVAVHCRFAFEIDDVPEAETYEIQIGSLAPFAVSRGELEAEDWNVSFAAG